VLNYALGTSLEEVRARKDLFFELLNAFVLAFEAGDREFMLEPFIDTGDELYFWELEETVECPDCGGAAWRYVDPLRGEDADDEDMIAHNNTPGYADAVVYCPNCWVLEAHLGDNLIAHATRQLERQLRRLPPGCSLTGITIGGTTIPFDPPIPNPYEPRH